LPALKHQHYLLPTSGTLASSEASTLSASNVRHTCQL
jgi:hypothetical protein